MTCAHCSPTTSEEPSRRQEQQPDGADIVAWIEVEAKRSPPVGPRRVTATVVPEAALHVDDSRGSTLLPNGISGFHSPKIVTIGGCPYNQRDIVPSLINIRYQNALEEEEKRTRVGDVPAADFSLDGDTGRTRIIGDLADADSL